MSYSVHVLHNGYSYLKDGVMRANCTCTLIKGPNLVIVDTMTAWDKDVLLEGLAKENTSCADVKYAVGTHGHSDHLGNLNLFTAATHIVGYSVSYKDEFFIHPFETGEPYKIDDSLQVIPTPGHTTEDVSVVVKTAHQGTVVVAGDLFEREEDISDPSLWRYIAGSENPDKQQKYRNEVILLADHIVPGHGPMFKVTEDMKAVARRDQLTQK